MLQPASQGDRMNRDDVIRAAREAGAPGWWIGIGLNGEVTGSSLQWLERFAAMAARHVVSRTSPAMVVNAAEIDQALLHDMLAKASQMPMDPVPPAAPLAFERSARIAAQTENEQLKAQRARSGVEQRRAVREAVLAEREACAVLAESEWSTDSEKAYGDELASYIRARGAA